MQARIAELEDQLLSVQQAGLQASMEAQQAEEELEELRDGQGDGGQAAPRRAMLCCAVLCYAMLCCAICCAMLCCAMLCCAVLC